MCNFFSCIIKRDGSILTSDFTDSHEDLIKHFGLNDSSLHQRDWIRAEFVPTSDLLSDLSTWRFTVDDSIPSWWDEDLKCLAIDSIKRRIRRMFNDTKQLYFNSLGGNLIIINDGKDCSSCIMKHGGIIKHVQEGSHIYGSRFEQTNLSHLYFKNVIMANNKFINSNLKHSRFESSQLEDSIFHECNLSNAVFSNSNLINVCFTNSIMAEIDFITSNLSYAKLGHAIMCESNFQNVNLSNANLSYSLLMGSNMYKTNLHNADLRHSNLTDVDLTCTNLKGTKLTGAILHNANLKDAERNLSDPPIKGWKLTKNNLLRKET